jgi:Flp pilus assembly protein TadG
MTPANLLLNFKVDTRGNVLMLSALIIPVLMALMGVAIDFQFTVSQKNKVQRTLDSAVLAGALLRQDGASEAEVQIEVDRYARAMISKQGGELTCGAITVSFDTEAEDVRGHIKCDQPTFISQMIGYDKMDFQAASVATYGIGRVDVAFIFDVSGSMNSNNRLSNLQASAAVAFDELLPDDQARDGSVRLGIVTYNHSLNAGAHFNQVTRRRRFASDTGNRQARNRYNRHNDARLEDTSNGNQRYFYYEQGTCLEANQNDCDEFSPYDWDAARSPFMGAIADNTCVSERIGAEAFTDAAPARNARMIAGNPHWDFDASDRFKWYGQREIERWGADAYSYGAYTGRFATCRDSGPVALTEDKAALNAHVQSLTANGGTAGHLGIAWGWYLVSPNWAGIWPAASEPGAYDDPDVSKAVILMTDGDFNTAHPDAGANSFNQAVAICDAMKDEDNNIQIYTVGFQVPGNVQTTPDGQTIMQYCATSAGHAFNADNGEQLTEVYRAIARSISDLRIKE